MNIETQRAVNQPQSWHGLNTQASSPEPFFTSTEDQALAPLTAHKNKTQVRQWLDDSPLTEHDDHSLNHKVESSKLGASSGINMERSQKNGNGSSQSGTDDSGENINRIVQNAKSNEAKHRDELIQAMKALSPDDIKVMRSLHRNRTTLPLRVLLYMTPILGQAVLGYDFIYAWLKSDSIRRIKAASEAYEKYRDNVSIQAKYSFNEKLVDYALSRAGANELRAQGGAKTLRSMAISEIRNYATRDSVRQPGVTDTRDEIAREFDRGTINRTKTHYMSQLGDGSSGSFVDDISKSYINDQVINHGGARFINSIDLLADYTESFRSKLINPFVKTRLIHSRSAAAVKKIASAYGTNVLNSGKEIAQSTGATLANEIAKHSDKLSLDLNSTIKTAVTAIRQELPTKLEFKKQA